jgi:hypothetical protein
MNNLIRFLSIAWINSILTIMNTKFVSGFVLHKSTNGWSPMVENCSPFTSLYMHNHKDDGKKPTNKSRRNRDRSTPKGFGAAIRQLQMETFPYAGNIRPGRQSPQRTVTGEEEKLVLQKPDYWSDGMPKAKSNLLPWVIEVKTSEEILKMRAAARAAREVLDLAGKALAPGVTTDAIDALVHRETIRVRYSYY